MRSAIHPTAIVAKEAQIAHGVEIGPYTIVGPKVKIGAGTKIANHVVLEGYTTIGENCKVFSGACLGAAPQDKKYKGLKSFEILWFKLSRTKTRGLFLKRFFGTQKSAEDTFCFGPQNFNGDRKSEIRI